MFDGKMKAVTFSFDDGVTQDRRLIEIFDKYNLKCTFNLNSGLFGKAGSLFWENVTIPFVRPLESEIKNIYKGHEVAAHTLTHPLLTDCSEEDIIHQVEEDRKKLSRIVGYEVKGMAYPCGGENNSDRVADIIKNNTGIKYARTITSTYNFDLQNNLMRFNPTVSFVKKEEMTKLLNEFLNLKTNTPKLFYIWGHSFQMDIDNSWGWFDDFCKNISNREEVFYGTNSQVFGL